MYNKNMTIKNEIRAKISDILREFKIPFDIDPVVEYPADKKFGDFSTNVALLSAKHVKKSPMELADEIAEIFNKENTRNNLIEKAEVIRPGFINFWIKSDAFVKSILETAEGKNDYPEGSKAHMGIEHTGPNTNKPLHIGHIRNTVLGMALVRLSKAAGIRCESWNINNDRGIHIVKSMWAYRKFGKNITPEKITISDWENIQKEAGYQGKFEHLFRNKPDHFVGMFYVIGANKYEDDESAKKEMEQMLIDWEASDLEVRSVWKQMNEWFYEGSSQTLSMLGTKFDHEWYESEISHKGKPIIEKAVKEKKLNRAEDGHVEADLSKYNLPNVVLLRSNGTALYITQDIELARQRIQDKKVDIAMVVTGHEQNLRFQQLYRVCEILGIADYTQLKHLGYGMVRLKEGRMSSRQGTGITADDLIEEVKKQVEQIMSSQEEDLDYQKRVEQVTVGAIKYTILKHGVLSDISFDIDSSIKTDGDSGPYLQYTYARTQSILAKVNDDLVSPNLQNINISPEERDLLRVLTKYAEIVEDAAIRFAPNILCSYLFDLAQIFNLFYQKHQILKSEGESRNFRVFLSLETGRIIKTGLYLLGIDAPTKM